MYILCFDGLFRGLPGELDPQSRAGVMCYGWLVTQDGHLIAQGHGAFARGHHANSNIAEYLALIEGLDAMLDLGISHERVHICGDAKTVIDQMVGAAEVKASCIKPLHRRATGLAARFKYLEFEWTPRRRNHAADTLTRRAMRQLRQDREQYLNTLQAITPGDDGRYRNTRFLPLMDLRIYNPARSSL